ncbi:MAG: PAS domain S-box protein, partial [Candidatus Omnitrophota bacterium]
RDAFGKPTHMIGTNWDITAQKLAEAAVRESEANFHAFFESMTDMIMVGAPDGRILFNNTAVTRTLGYSAEELASKRLLDLHPADNGREAEEILAAMFRGERNSCPLPLARKDGSLVPAETRVWFGRWNGEDCLFGISKNMIAEQESQQRFERLFRNNPALMALSSLPDQRFFDVNDTFLRAFGYSREEVIGKTVAELNLFLRPEQQASVVGQLQAYGNISGFELQTRCKDGAILDGLFSGEVISSQGRRYFLTVMIDITQRRRAEEHLRQVEEKFRILIENIHDIVYTLTPEGIFTFVSSSWTAILGHPESQILGKSFKKFVHPEDIGRCEEFLRNVIETGQPQAGIEYRVQHADGSWQWHQSNGVAVRDEAGAIVGLEGIAHDITARKRAEADLKESHRFLTNIIENIPDMIFVKDVENLHFKLVNKAGEALLGHPRESLYGKSDRNFFPSEEADFFIKKDRDVLRTKKELDIPEENILTKEKGPRILHTKKIPILDEKGDPLYLLGISEDITERKNEELAKRESEQKHKEMFAEKALSQEELKISYAELKVSQDDLARSEKLAYTGRIAASIAHEIRNPLTNVSLSVGQLKKSGRIKPEGLVHGEIIERNVARINFLITELLNCARPAKLNPQPYDIHQVIQDALTTEKGKISSQKVKVVKRLIAHPSILRIDKEHMGRVLLNLIENAVDAMPDGGKLTITTEIKKDLFLIKVEDSGKGIPEKDIIKIFDPFFSTKPQGVGLGLVTCYGIIVSHGGTIEVESKWRTGTTFTIYLPMGMQRERERERESKSVGKGL